jgi:hypothetical protein
MLYEHARGDKSNELAAAIEAGGYNLSEYAGQCLAALMSKSVLIYSAFSLQLKRPVTSPADLLRT